MKLNFLLCVVAIIACQTRAFAQPTILHIGQDHGKMDFLIEANQLLLFQQDNSVQISDINPEKFMVEFRDTYQSQKRIYTLLESNLTKNAHTWVYDEISTSVPSPEVCEDVQRHFKKFTLEKPTFEQMLRLVVRRPAVILFCLGKLKHYKPAEDTQANGRAMEELAKIRMNSGNSDPVAVVNSIFVDRGQCLADQVNADLSQSSDPDQKVIIVYGAGHDLKKYFSHQVDRKDLIFERVDTAFWNGKRASFDPWVDFSFAEYAFRKVNSETQDDSKSIMKDGLQKKFDLVFQAVKTMDKRRRENPIGAVPLDDAAKLKRERYDALKALFDVEQARDKTQTSTESFGITLDQLKKEYHILLLMEVSTNVVHFDDFMIQMVPVYHPGLIWDEKSQSIQKISR